MRKLKCVVSIVLGALLGLIASCVHSREKTGMAPAADKAVTNKTSGVQAPKKSEELPVRRPILE